MIEYVDEQNGCLLRCCPYRFWLLALMDLCLVRHWFACHGRRVIHRELNNLVLVLSGSSWVDTLYRGKE